MSVEDLRNIEIPLSKCQGNKIMFGIRYDLNIFIYVVSRFKITEHIVYYLRNFKFQPFLLQVPFLLQAQSSGDSLCNQAGCPCCFLTMLSHSERTYTTLQLKTHCEQFPFE